ncbi:hypothetical protein PHYBLDRAFT_172086 [Phycomyces blakesleeanus NRRL 1555(-)]|uniref:Uncharacterized protein n=1 Tax=Phycomyces blakesleeanus (strain ATCC 8743b / DSM 1359 / FGSC 10004 / NBRC 33097 / NRRL 1555) TaxID=763407 RepID=A0A167L2L4_PHYB8|nr:hypothetical protein PHYBLDRAFT_172086 [Phycomyces blakesleeanus NRRL 1555(-)]OAD69447.1 hypothetical protein PHYBLDRAFT_172086 [Phycomyces blakesleeanus NRRL 1555(-)]|eukprot:XP_018287487.1 hypothetical protein PHYBLDRAFT_172086 [Phycomyces blakesleeanus NRRL 1555(-)]
MVHSDSSTAVLNCNFVSPLCQSLTISTHIVMVSLKAQQSTVSLMILLDNPISRVNTAHPNKNKDKSYNVLIFEVLEYRKINENDYLITRQTLELTLSFVINIYYNLQDFIVAAFLNEERIETPY